jgi:hypothetical protein
MKTIRTVAGYLLFFMILPIILLVRFGLRNVEEMDYETASNYKPDSE